jgi:hypothetical protein
MPGLVAQIMLLSQQSVRFAVNTNTNTNTNMITPICVWFYHKRNLVVEDYRNLGGTTYPCALARESASRTSFTLGALNWIFSVSLTRNELLPIA